MSVSGGGKAPGADQARWLTSSTEADWGGRSHGGPGHGVALPAAGRGWALSGALQGALATCEELRKSDSSESQRARRTGVLATKRPQHPGWAHTTVGPRPGPRAPGRPPAARRALAGSARVSVEGAGTGEHHMPALPSKGKSRDLSVAALIPVSAYGVVKRLGSPDEEQHALLLFLSDSGNGGRAGSLG